MPSGLPTLAVRRNCRGIAEAAANQAVWGGGETPTLRGIVIRTRLCWPLGDRQIRPNGAARETASSRWDAMVMLASSGVHTNGLTLAVRWPIGFRRLSDADERWAAVRRGVAGRIGDLRKFIAALQRAKIQPAVRCSYHGSWDGEAD